MTHDELLAKIQSNYEENKHFRDEPDWKSFAALRAVVELHKPHHYGMDWMPKDLCSNCMEEQGDYMSPRYMSYPCPTIKAIQKALA